MSDQQQPNTEQLPQQQMNNNQQEVIRQEQHNNDRQQEVIQPHIKLTADEEKNLKDEIYKKGQSGQMYQNIDPKAQASMNRHGRDHGQRQIQRRSQNH